MEVDCVVVEVASDDEDVRAGLAVERLRTCSATTLAEFVRNCYLMLMIVLMVLFMVNVVVRMLCC